MRIARRRPGGRLPRRQLDRGPGYGAFSINFQNWSASIASSPAGAAQPAHRCPPRDASLDPAAGTQHSEARPVPTHQNSRFWMSATSRTVIARGIPNESLFVSRGSVGLFRGLCGALRALWLYPRSVAPGLPRGRVWPSSCRTSRSFVLASLRALHLDLRRRRRQGGSDRAMASSAPGTDRSRRWVAGRGRSVVTGPGSGLSEEPVPGVQSGRAGGRVVPRLPSRAPGAGCGAPGAGLQAGEHGVADLPLQRAQGFFGCLALGQLLVVVGAALAVPVADLGDRCRVDGMAVPPVPAPGQPAGRPLAGGHLDRRGAVVSGEVVPAWKPGHVADVADHRGGDDGADPEQPSQARPRPPGQCRRASSWSRGSGRRCRAGPPGTPRRARGGPPLPPRTVRSSQGAGQPAAR
jgi:hypothetical protein